MAFFLISYHSHGNLRKKMSVIDSFQTAQLVINNVFIQLENQFNIKTLTAKEGYGFCVQFQCHLQIKTRFRDS